MTPGTNEHGSPHLPANFRASCSEVFATIRAQYISFERMRAEAGNCVSGASRAGASYAIRIRIIDTMGSARAQWRVGREQPWTSYARRKKTENSLLNSRAEGIRRRRNAGLYPALRARQPAMKLPAERTPSATWVTSATVSGTIHDVATKPSPATIDTERHGSRNERLMILRVSFH